MSIEPDKTSIHSWYMSHGFWWSKPSGYENISEKERYKNVSTQDKATQVATDHFVEFNKMVERPLKRIKIKKD